MTKVMEVLFSYAQDYLEWPLLLLEPEYETTLHHANSQEQRLLALLDEGGKELLDDLISERNLLHSVESEALFRAGFRIALELNR